jgi:hypothetical protein
MQQSHTSSTPNAIRFSCCGVRVAVEFDPVIPPSDVRSILPPEFHESEHEQPEHYFSLFPAYGIGDQTGQRYLVRNGAGSVSSPESLDQALIVLHKKLRHCVAEYACERIFIHAGVVAWKGRAIVCPGSSHAGKSTLIWSLVNAGGTYYSDEYAVFDSSGFVHPFPLPITLRLSEGPRRVIAERIGTEPLPPGLILFAPYQGDEIWEPHVLTPGQTGFGLMRNSVSMRRNPSAVFAVLKTVALTAKAYDGVRGEAATVIEWLKNASV